MKLPSPVDVALAQLASPIAAIRKLGAQALCNLKPHSENHAIREAFRLEPDQGVAKWLALALGKIGDRGNIDVLTQRLKTLPDNDFRDWIIVSLNMLHRYASNQAVMQRLESNDPSANKEGLILSWNNSRIGKKTTKKQRELLKSDDPSVRRWASLAIGSQKDFAVDELILEHLRDPDYLALEWTEHVITGRVTEAALPTLQANLGHPQPRVREWAIKALASAETPGVYAHLMRHYIAEPDEFCRDAIIRSLGNVSSTPEVHDFLIKLVKKESSPVILAALIDLSATNDVLRKDEIFVEALVAKVSQMNNSTLRIALARSFSSHLSRDDRDVLERMSASDAASEAWDFLTALHWNNRQDYRLTTLSNARRERHGLKTKTDDNIVAVLIAKKEEFRAFVPLMGEYEPREELDTGKSIYRFTFTDATKKPLHVVAMFVGGMGNERSALWAQKLNTEMRPMILVNLGIAGGIHEDVRLGDVVVAKQVENYLADAKAVPTDNGQHFLFDLAGDPFKTDAFLVNIAQNFEFAYADTFTRWQSACAHSVHDVPEKQRLALQKKGFLGTSPALEEGHVASGPIVGAAEAFITWLKKQRDRTYLALEMESAGGALALHEGAATARHLVIRGISDFADERKKNLDAIGKGGIRKLAMQNATRFLIAILGVLNLDAMKTLGEYER